MRIFYAALFNAEPVIGEVPTHGEVHYTGYERVPFISLFGTNIEDIIFPANEDDKSVFVSHFAALDEAGKVVEVKALK